MLSRFGISLALALALALAGCGSSDDAAAAGGGLRPPAWIQGKWEGGSPIVLQLRFTADRILDENGKDALPGYREVGSDADNYLLTDDASGWSSHFSRVSATKMRWLITTPKDSTLTVMTKK